MPQTEVITSTLFDINESFKIFLGDNFSINRTTFLSHKSQIKNLFLNNLFKLINPINQPDPHQYQNQQYPHH